MSQTNVEQNVTLEDSGSDSVEFGALEMPAPSKTSNLPEAQSDISSENYSDKAPLPTDSDENIPENASETSPGDSNKAKKNKNPFSKQNLSKAFSKIKDGTKKAAGSVVHFTKKTTTKIAQSIKKKDKSERGGEDRNSVSSDEPPLPPPPLPQSSSPPMQSSNGPPPNTAASARDATASTTATASSTAAAPAATNTSSSLSASSSSVPVNAPPATGAPPTPSYKQMGFAYLPNNPFVKTNPAASSNQTPSPNPSLSSSQTIGSNPFLQSINAQKRPSLAVASNPPRQGAGVTQPQPQPQPPPQPPPPPPPSLPADPTKEQDVFASLPPPPPPLKLASLSPAPSQPLQQQPGNNPKTLSRSQQSSTSASLSQPQASPAPLRPQNVTPHTPQVGTGGKSVFQSTLADSVAAAPAPEDPNVPEIVYRCIKYIELFGLNEEGIFRISGSSSEVTKLKQLFATGQRPVDLTGSDANAVASLLKLYFRELPDQIFTQQFFVDLGSVYTITDTRQRLERLRRITADSLPRSNFGVVSHLFQLLYKIAQNRNVNRMNPNNLAIVFSPTLKITPELCQYLVENAPDIFPPV
jgi:hypothetical protein